VEPPRRHLLAAVDRNRHAATTVAGTDVIITPVVPDGAPPVTLTFDEAAAAGETTVAVLDPTVAPTTPPSGFQFGDPPQYYEIETSAILAPGTSVTMCFSYAGIDFGGDTPRLFHYVNGAWVDITTSVDTTTQTLCGSASSFSPFAIFTSPKTFPKGFGFYAPVSPLAGFVNTAKAGSTVPLTFNVTVNGIQKTDISGLVFGVSTVACTLAPEEPVD